MKKYNFLIALSLLMLGCGRFGNEEEKQNNKERIVVISTGMETQLQTNKINIHKTIHEAQAGRKF